MSNVIHRNNYRIDEYSQRMLSALTDGDKTVSQLRDESGLGEWESADYRLKEHLIPGGWVEKVGESPKTMALTPEGSELIENEGFDTPTLSEIRETALEASETAQSARESADRFRKQLYQVRQRLDRVNELNQSVDDLSEQVATFQDVIHDGDRYIFNRNFGKIDELRRKTLKLERELGETEQELTEQLADLDDHHETTREKISDLAEAHNRQVERINELEKELRKERKRNASQSQELRELSESVDRLHDRIERVEEDREKTLFSRLWPF